MLPVPPLQLVIPRATDCDWICSSPLLAPILPFRLPPTVTSGQGSCLRCPCAPPLERAMAALSVRRLLRFGGRGMAAVFIHEQNLALCLGCLAWTCNDVHPGLIESCDRLPIAGSSCVRSLACLACDCTQVIMGPGRNTPPPSPTYTAWLQWLVTVVSDCSRMYDY